MQDKENRLIEYLAIIGVNGRVSLVDHDLWRLTLSRSGHSWRVRVEIDATAEPSILAFMSRALKHHRLYSLFTLMEVYTIQEILF